MTPDVGERRGGDPGPAVPYLAPPPGRDLQGLYHDSGPAEARSASSLARHSRA